MSLRLTPVVQEVYKRFAEDVPLLDPVEDMEVRAILPVVMSFRSSHPVPFLSSLLFFLFLSLSIFHPYPLDQVDSRDYKELAAQAKSLKERIESSSLEKRKDKAERMKLYDEKVQYRASYSDLLLIPFVTMDLVLVCSSKWRRR